jgi:hypothetical protein
MTFSERNFPKVKELIKENYVKNRGTLNTPHKKKWETPF